MSAGRHGLSSSGVGSEDSGRVDAAIEAVGGRVGPFREGIVRGAEGRGSARNQRPVELAAGDSLQRSSGSDFRASQAARGVTRYPERRASVQRQERPCSRCRRR